jgi:hypothetical protein
MVNLIQFNHALLTHQQIVPKKSQIIQPSQAHKHQQCPKLIMVT